MGRTFICDDDSPLVVPDPDCPNAVNHQPHPAGYIAHSAWAGVALQVARQGPCPGCGGWSVWTPLHPDLRVSAVWPIPGCRWPRPADDRLSCGAEGVGERLCGEVWVPVCADHTGVPR